MPPLSLSAVKPSPGESRWKMKGYAYYEVKERRGVEGPSHWTDEGLAYDARRTNFLRRAGWRELRVSKQNVYTNLDNVLAEISRQLNT